MAVIAYCEKAVVLDLADGKKKYSLPATIGGEPLLAYQVGENAGVACYKVWTDSVSFTGLDLGTTWFSTSLDEAETRWKANTSIYAEAVKTCRDQIIDGGTVRSCAKNTANVGKFAVHDVNENEKLIANPLKV